MIFSAAIALVAGLIRLTRPAAVPNPFGADLLDSLIAQYGMWEPA